MILVLFFIDAALSKMFHATSAINITRFPELEEENSNFITIGLIANYAFLFFFFFPTDCLHLFIGELNFVLCVTFNMGNAKPGKVIRIISPKPVT